jgi:hypothetical protein
MAAPENASTPPQEGLYRFRTTGTREATLNGSTTKTPISGFEPHVIRDLEKSSDTLWRFSEVATYGGGVRVTEWSVNTAATQKSVSPPYVGENAVRAGEPGRGVALVSIEDYDGNGNLVASFAPSTPVLFLPLPVIVGESFNGVGVDPKSGQSMRFDGEVQKRQTVDACGTLVDGWFVKATITESGPTTYTHTDELIISTERGGQLISRHSVVTETNAAGQVTTDQTTSLGQDEPSPAEGRS